MFADQRDYYFGAYEATSLGVRVYACGHEVAGEHPPPRPTWSMKRYGLVYLVRGGGLFESASFRTASVSPGQALILFPDEPHRYGAPPGGVWEEYWFRVDGFTIRALQKHGLLDNRRPLLTVGLGAEHIDLCDRMIQLAQDPASEKRLIPGMLLHLLNSFLVPRRTRTLSLTAGKVLTIVKKVRRDPGRDWDFAELARDHGLSYSLLRKQLTMRYGVPPHQFLVQERMRVACESLAEGSSVKQACERSGMSDQHHFSKLFKKVMGQAPRVYAGSIRRQGVLPPAEGEAGGRRRPAAPPDGSRAGRASPHPLRALSSRVRKPLRGRRL